MKKIFIAVVVLMTSACYTFADDTVSVETPEEVNAISSAADKEEVNTGSSVADNERDEELQQLLDENKRLKQKEEQSYIWGKGRFTKLGYAAGQTMIEGEPVERCKFGFFLQKGTQYKLATVADMVKFNLDAVWFDAQFTKYQDPYMKANWTNEVTRPSEDPGDIDDVMSDITDFTNSIGRMSLNIGLGIGPSVQVAPFKNMARGLRPLTATLYFHYLPTGSIYFRSEDDDLSASFAYTNQFEFGGNIRYRWIAVGLEGHFGQGKFKEISDFFDDGEDLPKNTRKFASTRFYVSFTF